MSKITIRSAQPSPEARAVIDELRRDCAVGDPGVNLDGEFPAWLLAFAEAAWDWPREVAPLIFPAEQLAKSMPAVRKLGAYAKAKANAMTARLDGEIVKAMFWEQECQNIYESLPHWARTW